MSIEASAFRGAKIGAGIGLALGVVYSFGGLVVDLVTTGLNWGTAMAFMALIGMPALFGVIGLVLGVAHGILRRAL